MNDDGNKKDGSTYNFEYKKKLLVQYMFAKIEEGNWHAVSDAANDLRVLEAKCNHKFLVESGIRMSEVVIDGKKFVKIVRK